MTENPIFFFDGVCGLCNKSVDFILRHDKNKTFRFVPLQDEKAITLLREGGESTPPDFSTSILRYHGRFYKKSDAYFLVMKELGFPWSLLSVFRIVPRFIRDKVYDWTAKNRHRFFGVRESCRIPSPEEREQFL